jgi:putative endonuclease
MTDKGGGSQNIYLELNSNTMRHFFVYILASAPNGTLYIGVTNNLVRRVYEHKHYLVEGFTSQYNVHILVWYEQTSDAHVALQREKQMKSWKRSWKIGLIERHNPLWRDLYNDGVVTPLPLE